jgi:hypothetical protein
MEHTRRKKSVPVASTCLKGEVRPNTVSYCSGRHDARKEADGLGDEEVDDDDDDDAEEDEVVVVVVGSSSMLEEEDDVAVVGAEGGYLNGSPPKLTVHRTCVSMETPA